ncbi:MAG: radical SAM protein [Hyphomicrobiales bacterium]|nr:radical SAM protein [Hyphomicrobiales bacterium]
MANILLLEPGYRNKYPPLGLMKISAYHRAKGDHIVFAKGVKSKQEPEISNTRWDRIYITTLFSFEFKKIAETIDFAINCVGDQRRRVFVGGIAASLMHEAFLQEPRWFGVRFISGLLDKPPAESLQLDIDEGDFYADDMDGMAVEDHTPDYSILDHISDEYVYPVHDAYFGYASRGCIRKCHFCGVPKLEGGQRDGMAISELIRRISNEHGEKRDLILMDNNVSASARYKEIIAEIRDNGFEKGAKLKRGKRSLQRRVDFNQGVDARILCKDKIYLREMSTICLRPLRIAFDHLGLKKSYVQAVRYANEFEINHLSNYMLYNFYDTPADLFERLRINIDLNEELGVRIWSFPMRYQPVTLKDRSHVGEKWIWYWLRSFQIILQATHGVVSGNPTFFKYAFGDTQEEFETLLSMPHYMIMHRDYYDFGEGKAKKEQYRNLVDGMTESQRHDLLDSLAQITSSGFHQLDGLISTQSDSRVKKILTFHRPIGKEEEDRIREKTRSAKLSSFGNAVDPALGEDERVEDAGLYDNEPASKGKSFPQQEQPKRRRAG